MGQEPTKPKKIYLVVQQGGSSDEMYLHTFDAKKDVAAYRRSAAKAGYRTSEPIETTETIEKVLEAVQAAVDAAVAMR